MQEYEQSELEQWRGGSDRQLVITRQDVAGREHEAQLQTGNSDIMHRLGEETTHKAQFKQIKKKHCEDVEGG